MNIEWKEMTIRRSISKWKKGRPTIPGMYIFYAISSTCQGKYYYGVLFVSEFDIKMNIPLVGNEELSYWQPVPEPPDNRGEEDEN